MSVRVVQSPRTCEQQIIAHEHLLKLNENAQALNFLSRTVHKLICAANIHPKPPQTAQHFLVSRPGSVEPGM